MSSVIKYNPVCLFCGNTKTHATPFEDTVFNNKTFEYVQCSACDLIFVNPLPNMEDITKMYPVEYQGALAGDAYGRYDDLFRRIESTGKYTSILDYGCGGGRFVVEAIQHGYVVTGTEYNPDLVRSLQDKFTNASFVTIDDFFQKNDKYDIIFLSNVLEHLTNPKEIMLKLKDRLSENGIFVLEGPVENNFNVKQTIRKAIFFVRKYLFKKKAAHVPTHILYSNRKNQEDLFKNMGLETLYYDIDESNWPFPSVYANCKTALQKILYYVASFSVFTSKIVPSWGNSFTYIGKIK